MEPSTAEVAITRGETLHKDVKPTAEQLSAVAQLIASGAPPYVDVASFGPLLRNLCFVNFTYLVDTGGMRKNERPGPTDFDTGWKSWLVLKCAFLLLGAVKVERWGVHQVPYTPVWPRLLVPLLPGGCPHVSGGIGEFQQKAGKGQAAVRPHRPLGPRVRRVHRELRVLGHRGCGDGHPLCGPHRDQGADSCLALMQAVPPTLLTERRNFSNKMLESAFASLHPTQPASSLV